MGSVHVERDEILVSFDVSSLFTRPSNSPAFARVTPGFCKVHPLTRPRRIASHPIWLGYTSAALSVDLFRRSSQPLDHEDEAITYSGNF